MIKPPEKLSELMKLALEDLAKVETDPDYVVDMEKWHVPSYYGGVCLVCFGGSVIAKTLKVSKHLRSSPIDLSREWDDALRALDYVRDGEVGLALSMTHRVLSIPPELNCIKVTKYHMDRNAWREDMNKIVAALEEKGL